MPLDKPEGLDLRHTTYETKVAIVEANCTGCQYFKLIRIEEDIYPVVGCTYPADLRGRNLYLSNPYLDLVEIATNTCQFWRGRMMEPVPPPDSTPGSEKEWSEVPVYDEYPC